MFTIIKYLKNRFTRRATIADLGKRVSVSWDKGSRQGFIDRISPDGGFDINFDGNAIMVVPAVIYGWRKNPFKSVTFLN